MLVKFNGSKNWPLITDEWSNVRHAFNIQGDKMLLLTYLRDNLFHIFTFYYYLIDPFKLPSNHTYHLGLNNSHFLPNNSQLIVKSCCFVWTSRCWSRMQYSEKWYLKEVEHKIWKWMGHILYIQWFCCWWCLKI